MLGKENPFVLFVPWVPALLVTEMLWDTTGSQGVRASPALSHRVAQSLWHLQNKWSTEKCSLQEQQQHGGLHLTSWSQRWAASRMPNADRRTAHSHVISLSANALFFVVPFFPTSTRAQYRKARKGHCMQLRHRLFQLHPGRPLMHFIICLFIFRWLFHSLVTQLISNQPGRFLLLPSWLLVKQQSLWDLQAVAPTRYLQVKCPPEERKPR